jgi:hypothetical protein
MCVSKNAEHTVQGMDGQSIIQPGNILKNITVQKINSWHRYIKCTTLQNIKRRDLPFPLKKIKGWEQVRKVRGFSVEKLSAVNVMDAPQP